MNQKARKIIISLWCIIGIIAIIITTDFLIRIRHPIFYNLDTESEPYYETWDNVITIYNKQCASEEHNQKETHFINNYMLMAVYDLTAQEIFEFIEQGTDAKIPLVDPEGKTFEASIPYHVLLGLFVHPWPPFIGSFDEYQGLSLDDFPNVDPSANSHIYHFSHCLVRRTTSTIDIDGQSYTTFMLSAERLRQILQEKSYTTTLNGRQCLYIGSYSHPNTSHLFTDVYLSIDQINEYLQTASADNEHILLRNSSPNAKLEWHQAYLKMPHRQFKSFIIKYIVLSISILILALITAAHNDILMTKFLNYMHLNDDDEDYCDPDES